MSDGAVRPCEGCGFDDPQFRHSKKEAVSGRVFEECEKCFDSSIPQNPDIYFRSPYFDDQLGCVVTSKSHKAYLLKQRGWKEVGDRVHGKRNFDPIAHKHAMASLER